MTTKYKKKMKKKLTTIILLTIFFFMTGCQKRNEKATDENSQNVTTQLNTPDKDVRTIKIEPHDFNYELISNGKLTASQYADLVFPNSGLIKTIFVKNGDHVVKGQVIAELDTYSLQNALKQANINMEQAKLELQDILIGQGYAPDDFSRVPKDIMRLAMIKSGYERCKNDIEKTKYDIANTRLRAPFAGVVANVTSKAHNVSTSTPLCRIINTTNMDVEFTVLENELQMVHTGERVVITPIDPIQKAVNGTVTAINPLVDENGMIKVTARVSHCDYLLSGMNVGVSVHRVFKSQIVVPKTALVHRSNRLVVFTVDNGKAVWHYVQTGAENMNECVVTKGLEQGMEIIVSNNQNLSHGTEVKIHN